MSGASKILMGSGGVVLPSDDQFKNVSFLSHFDGSNNGTNIVYDDSSASNHTVSLTGTPQQGTFGPFARPEGEWSNYFDGNGDYLFSGSSADFGMGTGNFTWEAWVNQTYRDGSAESQLFSTGSYPSGNNISVWITTSGNVAIHYVAASSTFTTTSTFAINTWTHIAVVRKGTGTDEFSIYINGVAGITGTMSTDFSADNIILARHGSTTSNYFSGYISNFRIVKGTAVYTGNFTPSTSALTAITNTKMLTCQSNRFVDKSASAHALSTQGTPKVTAFGPYLTSKVYDPAVNGASAFFVGGSTATELLVDATGSDFAYGTGDFTIEGWYYREGTGQAYPYIYAMGNMMQFYFSSGNLNFYMKDSETGSVVWSSYSTTLGNVLNEWNHWAVSRSGDNLSAFVNGVRVATDASVDNTFSAASGGGDKDDMYLGGHMHNTSNYVFGGYLSDYRILKGTALYDPTSSTCTVPTAPLTAITNTKLLLNMADGQALDSAAQNNMTLFGNADTSTSQQKFGTASLALDETGDYVTIPHAKFTPFGTGNFTIECFVRFAASTSGNGQGLFQLSSGTLNSTTRGPAAGADNATGRWTIYYGTSYLTHGSIAPSTNTWYHVAYVRNSGTTKLYIDGTEILSVSDSTDYTDTYFTIGGWYTTDYLLNGYLDEFRISHVARYTSNFTPTTEAFPDKGQ